MIARDKAKRGWSVKPVIYSGLTLCFLMLSLVVYTDYPNEPPKRGIRLSEPAKRGQLLWRKNNCQACHAIYGFGGFLGPDLTNVSARLSADGIREILENGRGRMPRFPFSTNEIAHLVQYFEELDQSGQGTPLPPQGPEPGLADLPALQARTNVAPVPDSVFKGAEALRTYACSACHLPFRVGILEAPDLSLTFSSRDETYIRNILKEGKGNMPPLGLEGEPADALVAFLLWLQESREELVAAHQASGKRSGKLSQIPWFTYPRPQELAQ